MAGAPNSPPKVETPAAIPGTCQAVSAAQNPGSNGRPSAGDKSFVDCAGTAPAPAVVQEVQTWSAANLVPPAPPRRVRSLAEPDGRVVLTWKSPATPVTGYKVFRKVSGLSRLELRAELDPKTTSFEDVGLEPDKVYVYRIRSTNQGLDSTSSDRVRVALSELMAAPSGPAVADLTQPVPEPVVEPPVPAVAESAAPAVSEPTPAATLEDGPPPAAETEPPADDSLDWFFANLEPEPGDPGTRG